VAATVQLHRALGTFDRAVDRFIALNAFCRDKLVQGGLPEGRIVIKPNFVDLPAPPPDVPRSGLLYVGRLSQEKGLATLAEAWAQVGAPGELAVAGDGPLRDAVAPRPRVRMLGALAPADVAARMRGAVALVLPSIWYEAFPRTLVEAFACGLPVIASRMGALPELVQHGRTGLIVEPGNADDLARQMQWALDHPEAMREMGRHARAHYEAQWTGEHNVAQLLAIYATAAAEAGTRRPGG
jgi:glycosyltransferase involved in cell wall biosynthesis